MLFVQLFLMKVLLPSKHINLESTLKQHWSSTFINVVSTLIFGWKWADAHLSTLFQHWENNDQRTSKELRRFNVDEPTLFQSWNLVENESWADVCLSTLFQLWQNNVERITLIQCRWLNLASTLIFNWKSKLSQRMFIGVASTLIKQHWNNFVNICCTDAHYKVAK